MQLTVIVSPPKSSSEITLNIAEKEPVEELEQVKFATNCWVSVMSVPFIQSLVISVQSPESQLTFTFVFV